MSMIPLAHTISNEERTIDSMLDQVGGGVLPDQWPPLLRQVFAQAALPRSQSAPGRLPGLTLEHAKGLKLYRYFYPGRLTIESLPQWITGSERDPCLERSAERARHNLVRRIKMENSCHESGRQGKSGGYHQGDGS